MTMVKPCVHYFILIALSLLSVYVLAGESNQQGVSDARDGEELHSGNRLAGVSVLHLLDPTPNAMTTSTVMNRQVTLIPGVEYTISFWYWHWKTPHLPENHEMSLLTSRRALPYVMTRGVASSALLPAVIFNGMIPERYFFSVSRDANGHYSNGFWSRNHIRYHEWVHFAMTIEEDRFSVYLNGELQGIRVFPPAYKATDIYRQGKWDLFANNTIMQIGGGKGLISTPGMVSDVMIFQNITLNQMEIEELITKRPPPEMPTLYKVMREMDLYTLINFTRIDVKYSFYGEIAFGLCPFFVCGDVCIDESFYVGMESGVTASPSHQRIKRSMAQDSDDMYDVHSSSKNVPPTLYAGKPRNSKATRGSERSTIDRRTMKSSGSRDIFEDNEPLDSYDDIYDDYYGDEYYGYDDDEGYEDEIDAFMDGTGPPPSYFEKGLMSPELMNVDFGDKGRNARIRRVLDRINVRMAEEEEAMLQEEMADPRVEDYIDPYDEADIYAGVDGYDDLGPDGAMGKAGGLVKMIEFEIDELTEDDVVAIEDWARGREQKRRDRKEAARRRALEKEEKLKEILRNAEKKEAKGSNTAREADNKTAVFNRMSYKSPSILPKAIHWNPWMLSKRRNVIKDDTESSKSFRNIRIGGHSADMKYVGDDSVDSVIARLIAMGGYEDVYRSLYPEIPLRQIRVQHLYESAVLWSNSRHERFRKEAAWDFKTWEANTIERINSVMFLALWLADDIGSDSDVDNWSFHLPGSISHPIYLMLGFRHISLVGHSDAMLSDMVRLIDVDWKGRMTTYKNTDILSSLLGITQSRYATDVSLRNALGELRFVDILDAIRRNESNSSIPVTPLHAAAVDTVHSKKVSVVIGNDGATSTIDESSGEVTNMSRETTQTEPNSILELFQTPGKLSCEASVAYYFPVSQFVSAHFGNVESGISVPEAIRLSEGNDPISMTRGEDSIVHDLNVADAEHGDADAQMWLAMRYYWGYAGVQPNLPAARRYIERAAAANHPEGMYNLGVFHEQGIAGLEANPQLALEYFMRAAEHPRPFNMALFALGNYYRFGKGGVEKNVTRAINFFTRAALGGSQDAYFSLGSMARTVGEGYKPDIRLALYFYSRAAAARHVRSISTIAHALWDPESWLGEDIRLRDVEKRFDNLNILQALHEVDPAIERVWNQTIEQLKYNASEPILLAVDDFAVHLPEPHDFSCSIALELMKILAEHCLRAGDVTNMAVTNYLMGYKWPAVSYYDEASDLGIAVAQENAGYVYESLSVVECGEPLEDPVYPIELSLWNITMAFGRDLVMMVSDAINNFTGTKVLHWDLKTPALAESQSNVSKSNVPNLEGNKCRLYYERMAAIRRLQLIGNFDVSAMRQVAKQLTQGSFPFDRNATAGAILYGLAAELGDVQSLMALGWMVFHGKNGLTRNCTTATKLFSAAVKWEAMLRLDAFSAGTSGGLAPLLAWAHVLGACAWENVEENIGSSDSIGLVIKLLSSLATRYEVEIIAGLSLIFVYIVFLFDLRRRARALEAQ